MSYLASDVAGLESLPLKLAIVAVVAALSVMPAAQALAGLEDRDFVRTAEVQLNLVVTTAQILTVQGPGNVRTIGLDFRSEGRLGLSQLCIGDELGGLNSSAVILVLANGAVMVRVANDPPCVLCSPTKSGFLASQDVLDLRMSAEFDNRTTLIIVEAV